ncbi:hypothetical protein DYU11_11600 [Fibrisoma montanum]|uniref:Phage terminase large subunit N-terminal domain-containing protein n=1 Tax=Fibrisoma montanum TaxID=2305895 RepID=A0A418MB72_9BACT|nr:phage terminase large subunit [Fibrisoma montanum]RIV23619.1 hypothetical protein DYU11_11600 [Fibrisoma montanum]
MTALAPQSLVSFDPHRFPKAAQLFHAAHSGRYRVIVMGGAVRGGKSFGVLGTLLTLHKRFAGSRSIVVRDSLETLRNTTLPTVEKAMPNSFVKKFLGDPKFHWQFANGSSFQFFSEQAPNDPERKRWNGLEVNYIWLEQIEELEQTTFEKALERAGSYFIAKHIGQTPPPIIFVTLNPTDEWARAMFYDRYLNGTLPDNWLYIPATIEDNAGLEPSYLESLQSLKQTNPVKYKRFVEGDWDIKEKTGGEWYSSFEFSRHVAKVPFIPGVPLHASYDFNVKPYMTQLAAQLVRGVDRLQIRIFKEYTLRNPDNRTDRCCQALINDYLRESRLPVYYYGDRQGNNRIEGFGPTLRRFDTVRKELQLYLTSTSNQVNPAVVVNINFRDFINDVLAGLLPVEILIDENCTELIRDLQNTKEGKDGSILKAIAKDADGDRYEKNGHCLSAFTYLVGSMLFQLYLQWKKTPRLGKS